MASEPEPLAIVGDVHGEADRLMALLLRSEFSDRRVVFVGDLINRGPQSRRVLDIVLGLDSPVVVRGNHEQALLDVLNGASITSLVMLGGAPTILDYVGVANGDVGKQLRSAFPHKHREFLDCSLRVFRQDELVVSHDGRHPSLAPAAMVSTGDFNEKAVNIPAGEFWVFGHHPQRSQQPLVRSRLACIDTGAGGGGPITALLWPEREYLQS